MLRTSKMPMWLTILGVVIAAYVVLVGLAFLFQERLLYFPLRNLATSPASINLAYEEVRFEAADGIELSGWFIPAVEPKGVVLFFHGNAGNISHRLDSIATFHRLGLSVFIIDYRGYGQSEGRPTERGTYLDAEAAWRYLVQERQIRPTEIVLFGRSLGGAVAAWLAEQQRPAALILESTFTSVPDVAAQSYPFLPVRLLSRIHYDTLERLPKIDCPVLVIHSPDDRLIPYSHGRRLLAAAKEPKAFIALRGGHNEGFIIAGPEYEAKLAEFIENYVAQLNSK